MKALVTTLAFMIGLTIAGLLSCLVGELVFGGGPNRGPTWFVYAAAGAALGAGWGAAEWARNRFIVSSPPQKKAISSIIGLALLVCGAMGVGKIVGKWAAEFDAKPSYISQTDWRDIIPSYS